MEQQIQSGVPEHPGRRTATSAAGALTGGGNPPDHPRPRRDSAGEGTGGTGERHLGFSGTSTQSDPASPTAQDPHPKAIPCGNDAPDSGHRVVLLIGLYKLAKALIMLIVAVTALRLVHHNLVEVVDYWVRRLHLDPENRILEHQIVPRLARMTDARLRLLGAGALIYLVLYTVQGVGLMRERRWAEWLTVVSGLGLVPVETYGLVEHVTISRAILLGSNLAIAAFLYWHVRRKQGRGAC